jgi:hypothetical protein
MPLNKNTEVAPLARPSTKERGASPAEHRMKRMHEKKVHSIAEDMAAALNAAMRSGKNVR